MKTTGFIARRYLFSKKHVSLISTLTAISVAGVTIGTALLIVVLSVFNGFFDVIKGFLLQNDPDIRIESAQQQSFLYGNEMETRLSGIPEVTAASAFVKGQAMMVQNRENSKVVQVKGVDRERFFQINNMKEDIVTGTTDLSVRDGKPGLLVSQQVMGELNLQVGDEVSILSAAGMRKSLTQFSLPRNYRFELRGSFSRVQIVEGAAVYVDMEAAQRLFEVRRQISGIDVRLKDPDTASQIKDKLDAELGEEFQVSRSEERRVGREGRCEWARAQT